MNVPHALAKMRMIRSMVNCIENGLCRCTNYDYGKWMHITYTNAQVYVCQAIIMCQWCIQHRGHGLPSVQLQNDSY